MCCSFNDVLSKASFCNAYKQLVVNDFKQFILKLDNHRNQLNWATLGFQIPPKCAGHYSIDINAQKAKK